MSLSKTIPFARVRRCLACIIVVSSSACSSSEQAESPDDSEARIEFLLGYADPSTIKDLSLDMVRRSQESIQNCMIQEGYDYTPYAPQALFAAGPQLELTKEEFARNYGLGFITLSGPNVPVPSLSTDDPNGAMLAALSDEDEDAWIAAATICEQMADETVGIVKDFDEVQAAVEDLKRQIEQDPQVVAAASDWANCMREQGFDYPNPEVMRTEASQASNDLITAGAWAEDHERHAEYHAQTEREIALGLADNECYENLRDARRQALADNQSAFLAEHGDQLAV